MAAFPPQRRRKVFGFGQLAIGGSHRGSHIAERIPGLDKDQPSQPVASESDITRSIWIGRPSRKLEDPLEARLATRPQDELLNRKMARIANLGQRIATKFQSKGKVEAIATRCQVSTVNPPPRPSSSLLIVVWESPTSAPSAA